MRAKQKQPEFKVTVTYTPAPDCEERLKRVMGLLLRCPNPALTEETHNAEMENRTTH